MSGLERALASRAKSSSAAAVIDSASEEREGRVTRREGAGIKSSFCFSFTISYIISRRYIGVTKTEERRMRV